MFGLFVCVDRYEWNIRLSLVLKLALVTISGRRHLKSFIALRRHRCLDAATIRAAIENQAADSAWLVRAMN